MKTRKYTLITVLLILALFTSISLFLYRTDDFDAPVFFGVSFGGKTSIEAKLLIEKVEEYTNFFLVNSWDLCINETALTEVCDYAAEADLSFIIFFDFISLDPVHGYTWHREWVSSAKERWGDKFLGIYLYEEPGGKQIDTGLFDEFKHARFEVREQFEAASSYSEAAEIFVTELPKGIDFEFLQNENISKFTSDYALYWFDYMAGYDTIFVELGWNHSRAKHIGLCRGAAKANDKKWGSILTWTYDNPPYLANGSQILEDMILSYETGAEYIILFNYPNNPVDNLYGILLDEHFNAMEKFWGYIQEHPRDYGIMKGQVAFVLPKDYGWGMRREDDLIWGLWPADNLAPVIWDKMNKLIERYGPQLDILYNDSDFDFSEYSKVYYLNSPLN